MKIYTKTGDQGITSLLGGVRVPKSDLRIDAYGTLDELNAYIGLLRDQEVNKKRAELLKTIQDRLFTIGADLATVPGKNKVKKPDLHPEDVEVLEKCPEWLNQDIIVPHAHPDKQGREDYAPHSHSLVYALSDPQLQ